MPSFATVEGQQGQLTVQRTGSAAGAVSVDYEVIHATAEAVDYIVSSGTLSWADGIAADRMIAIDGVNDGVAEGVADAVAERVAVRDGVGDAVADRDALAVTEAVSVGDGVWEDDNDVDVVVASYVDESVLLIKNTDGLGNFSNGNSGNKLAIIIQMKINIICKNQIV